MKKGKQIKVLVSPLDWGLGHATRCIPIIKALLLNGADVIIAASGSALILLQNEFPQLHAFNLKGFSPKYSRKSTLIGRMILLIPSFLWSIWSEHRQLRKILKKQPISVVISDNRYGMWNRNTTNIFITHQVFIKAPVGWNWLNPVLESISRYLISFFDYCWIPDFKDDPNLSGELSHLKPLPSEYTFIGPLSRFEAEVDLQKQNNGILAIISGPEPQRTIFENLIISQLSEMKVVATVVCGKYTLNPILEKKGMLTVISFADSMTLKQLIVSSSLIICRSGYSSIMDLERLGKKALFVPTPGQTEQEYLANYFMSKGITLGVSQKELNLKEQIPEASKYPGFVSKVPGPLIQGCIELLLAKTP
ncbi:MAG: glycosyltransferase [Bacteroidetes bacterium]|nr:glycosyltransferase [Bacteroidota bacterium]